MSRKRRMFFKAAHRDKAERPIIEALRAVGASVFQVSGKDIPDLLVGYQGKTWLMEVKSRIEETGKGRTKIYTRTTKVSKGQEEFLATWKGGPAVVVHTPEEALNAIGAHVSAAYVAQHPLTPEHQRRETAAVVPPPRLKDDGFGTRSYDNDPNKPADLTGRRRGPKALAVAVAGTCECGHSKKYHLDKTGPCLGAAVGCLKGCAGFRAESSP